MKKIVILSLIVIVLIPTLAIAWTPRDECPWPRAEFTWNSFSPIKYYEATTRDKEIWKEKNTDLEYMGVLLKEHKASNAPATYLLVDKFRNKKTGKLCWELSIVVVERSFPVRVVHVAYAGFIPSEDKMDEYVFKGKKFVPEEFYARSLKTVILPKRGDTVKGWVNRSGGITPEGTAEYEALNKAVDRWYEKGGGKP